MVVFLASLILTAGSGTSASKAIDAYANSLMASGKITYPEYEAKMKAKADELLQGQDPKTMPTDEALQWAHVFDAAQRFSDSYTLMGRFLATKPSADDTVNASLEEANDLIATNQMEKAVAILKPLKPTPATLDNLAGMDAGVADMYSSTAPATDALDFIKTVKANLNLPATSNILKSFASTETRLSLVGQPAPELTLLPKMYGDFTDLKTLKGKVVVLDFFAHWCPPCKASMPDMRKMTDDLGSKGLDVIGVTSYYGYFGTTRNVKQADEFADMKGFIAQYKIDHPVVYIPRNEFATYGASGFPEFVLIGRDGLVKKIQVGYDAPSFKDFRAAVEAEVAKP